MNSNENNQITVIGTVVGTPDYSHSVGAERFLKGVIKVNRLSGQNDMLPFVVSERLVPNWTLGDEDEVKLNGQIRSHNVYDNPNQKGKLEVYIFVRSLMYELEITAPLVYGDKQSLHTVNNVYLTGALCKPPIYRSTPFGREICDMMIAVNRAFGKSDYIPCIAWGRTAKYIGNNLKVGDSVKIAGRFQSRDYTKVHPDGHAEDRTAYEVSVFKLIN